MNILSCTYNETSLTEVVALMAFKLRRMGYKPSDKRETRVDGLTVVFTHPKQVALTVVFKLI